MTLEELYEIKALEAARSIFVILAERTDGDVVLVRDPGMNKPWSSRNKLLAEDHARLISRNPQVRKAGAVTLEEAFTVLQKRFSETKKT